MTALSDREGTEGRNLGECRSAEPIRAGSRARVRGEEVPFPTSLPPRARGVCLGLVLHAAVTVDDGGRSCRRLDGTVPVRRHRRGAPEGSSPGPSREGARVRIGSSRLASAWRGFLPALPDGH